LKVLDNIKMKIYKNFDLKNYNSYKIKSKCNIAYFPESETDLINIYKSKKPFFLLGTGHNIILSKEYYEESFVILNGNFNNVKIDIEKGIIESESGITMLELSSLVLERGLSGLEIFYDIPSSLGGAVVMNAGASGEEIKDVLLKVRYLDLDDMKLKEINNSKIGFEYRNSFFQKYTNKVILKVWLQLKKDNRILIWHKMTAIKEKRWSKQPKEFPNAGSVFKRPKEGFVGPMLDELNLKGLRIGGAMVSKKHSGFIVNYNNATGLDILTLIDEIKLRVKYHFNIDLEVEQRII